MVAIILVTMMTMTYPGRAAASGADPVGSMFSFNGFGTVGVVHSSEDQADFTDDALKPKGAGYSSNWSAAVDSLIGAQITAHFTSQLSVVLQGIAEQNYNNTYTPHVEWANIKYQFTPDLTVRVGRIVEPSFLVSDFRKVKYASAWIRPPTEVYSQNPITHTDGVDASYRLRLGEVASTLLANYGRDLRYRLAAGKSLDTQTAWAISDSTEYGPALLRLGYTHASITLNPAIALFDAFRQFGPQGTAIADKYELVDKTDTILTIGASYDPGKWFAIAEWVRSRSDSFLGVSTAWYVSGGYRVGQFTPYLTYAQVTQAQRTAPGLTVSGLPPSLAPFAAALNGGLNELLATTRPLQHTSSVGVRWDFMKDFDLKLQFDHTRLDAGSVGTLINIQPGFQPGGQFNLFSAAVDFVF